MINQNITSKQHSNKEKRRAALFIAALMLIICLGFPADAHATAPETGVKGKTVLVEGDSIQASHGRFLESAAKKLGAKNVVNRSQISATFACNPNGNVGTNSVWYRISKMSKKQLAKYDYYFIGAGTNDWYSWSSIGYAKSIKSKDPATIQGAVNLTIKRIRWANPDAKIVIVSPLYRYRGAFSYFLKTDCDKRKNNYGKTLAQYRKAIEATAAQYPNVYIVSGTSISTKKEIRSITYTKDYLHPQEAYSEVLARRVVKILRAANV